MLKKVVFDADCVDLNALFKMLQESAINFCFVEDVLYCFEPDNTQKSITNIMKELNITNVFINTTGVEKDSLPDFVRSWASRLIEDEKERKINEERQDELQQMMHNIESIKALIESRKEGGVVNAPEERDTDKA